MIWVQNTNAERLPDERLASLSRCAFWAPTFLKGKIVCSMVKLCLVFLPLNSKCHFLMLAVNNGSHLTFIDLNIFTLHRLDVFSSALVLNRCTCNLPNF